MTAALEGGEWSTAGPGRTLPPGKIRYPLYRRLAGPQGRSGRAENLAPPVFDPQTFQLLVSPTELPGPRIRYVCLYKHVKADSCRPDTVVCLHLLLLMHKCL